MWNQFSNMAESGWTISSEMERQLKATECGSTAKCWRYNGQRVSNEVLQGIQTDWTLINTIRGRQMKFFGHIIRKEGLEELLLTGHIKRKRSWGRQTKQNKAGFCWDPRQPTLVSEHGWGKEILFENLILILFFC